jgi:hypothetical protein
MTEYELVEIRARNEIKELIQANPELEILQNQVEEILDKSENRLKTISYLVTENLQRQYVELLLLIYKLESL